MKMRSQYILFGALALVAAGCDRPTQKVPVQNPATPAVPILNYHALVIGVDDYAGTGWPQLGTARADAEAMGNILQSRYGFNVTGLTGSQATRGNILRALDQLMHLTANDALLIYFAGHGFYDKQMDEGYWIPHGAQRFRMGQPAKEDWLWNSSISRVLNALPAKHVLLMADTCYAGSLFRGEEEVLKSNPWYHRAMEVPSRYLITSGNLEPVLDSGIRHSVFAQEILNYLQYGDRDLFSASDIAVSIRAKVSELTGQLVRMGPLVSPAHAGGEFVFVRSDTELPAPVVAHAEPEKPVFRNAEPANPLQQLASQIETYSRKAPEDAFVRPRILACMGPTGGNPEEAAMVRSRLHKSLDAIGGCILVERKAFDTLLQEMNLGRSELADRRATTEIGKLLPASLILFGEIIPIGNQQEIHLRIVDTETSRVLSSASVSFTNHDDLGVACQTLAERIMKTMNKARPLLIAARQTESGKLRAGWGEFHGARIGDLFKIITRDAVGTISEKEIPLGIARLLSLGEEQAEFQAEWSQAATNRSTTLWLKAIL
ncbi:MAG: caspase family protein [Verrucomicrobiota bacterium]